jgi:hypothetical protein
MISSRQGGCPASVSFQRVHPDQLQSLYWLLLAVLARAARNWKPPLYIVQPNTLLGRMPALAPSGADVGPCVHISKHADAFNK